MDLQSQLLKQASLGSSGGDSKEARESSMQTCVKRAFIKASLRWHPDKFQLKFGSRLRASDRQQILARVQEVSQRINQEWSQWTH